MKPLCIISAIVMSLLAAPAYGSRNHYGGGHHTSSHGGSYNHGSGSSHKGGRYNSPTGGHHYGVDISKACYICAALFGGSYFTSAECEERS